MKVAGTEGKSPTALSLYNGLLFDEAPREYSTFCLDGQEVYPRIEAGHIDSAGAFGKIRNRLHDGAGNRQYPDLPDRSADPDI